MFSTCSELTPRAPIPDGNGTIYAALVVSIYAYIDPVEELLTLTSAKA